MHSSLSEVLLFRNPNDLGDVRFTALRAIRNFAIRKVVMKSTAVLSSSFVGLAAIDHQHALEAPHHFDDDLVVATRVYLEEAGVVAADG